MVGVFIILLKINVALTIMVFLFLPVMAVYALFFNRKMRGALQTCKDRIGDINARVEDTLAGIRVVKAFANEDYEMRRFAYANHRFLASRKDGYRNEAYYFGGLMGFAQLLTIAVIVFGSIAIVHASLDLADLLTYLLCVGILTDPIQKVVNFGRLYQEGITGFNRVMDILEVSPTSRKLLMRLIYRGFRERWSLRMSPSSIGKITSTLSVTCRWRYNPVNSLLWLVLPAPEKQRCTR